MNGLTKNFHNSEHWETAFLGINSTSIIWKGISKIKEFDKPKLLEGTGKTDFFDIKI